MILFVCKPFIGLYFWMMTAVSGWRMSKEEIVSGDTLIYQSIRMAMLILPTLYLFSRVWEGHLFLVILVCSFFYLFIGNFVYSNDKKYKVVWTVIFYLLLVLPIIMSLGYLVYHFLCQRIIPKERVAEWVERQEILKRRKERVFLSLATGRWYKRRQVKRISRM